MSIESYLEYLKALFESHIKDVLFPSLLFKNDLPSLEQQEDKITTYLASSSKDEPYL